MRTRDVHAKDGDDRSLFVFVTFLLYYVKRFRTSPALVRRKKKQKKNNRMMELAWCWNLVPGRDGEPRLGYLHYSHGNKRNSAHRQWRGGSPLTFFSSSSFGDTGKSLAKQLTICFESRRAEQRAKLPLATLAELWREGGMQSLGHRSTSLSLSFSSSSSSRKFSFLPPKKKCSLASTSCVTNAEGWRAGCAVPFLGGQAAVQSRNNRVWTQDRELWNNNKKKKKVEGFLHCRPPPSFSTAGWLLSLS